MNKPEKSFENPILFDDGVDEETLLKNKTFRSLQRKPLPEIDVDKSKLFSGNVEPDRATETLPDVDELPELDSTAEEEPEDGLDFVNELLEEFNNENMESHESDIDDSDEDDDDITLEDDDEYEEEYDESQIEDSSGDVIDIDPEILEFLQEVNLEEDDDDESQDWLVDDVDEGDDTTGDDHEEFIFSPLEDESTGVSPDVDELLEHFTTIEADEETSQDEEEESYDDLVDSDETEETQQHSIKGTLKAKFAEIKENIRSEIGDGGKNKPDSEPTNKGVEGQGTGFFSKVNSFFLNILLKLMNLLSKLPVIGKFFEPTEKLMTVLGRIASFVPLILMIVLLLMTNNMSINKTEVYDLPDEGQVKVQKAKYNKSDNTVKAEMVNTGDIIGEARVDFVVKSTQLSINPIHWFIPQEVTTCSSDWIEVDLGDIQSVTASCEDKELSGFWFRSSIEVVE